LKGDEEGKKERMEGMNSMKKKSDSYYDKAWRWVEDTYLKYFGENRTSYGFKGTLNCALPLTTG
jgi:hypothetical protein